MIWLGRGFSLQTTIMAVEYDGGVILGADSRTTTGESIGLLCSCIGSVEFWHESRACVVIAYDALKKNALIFIQFLCAFAGVYVANRASDKITQLTDNVYLCRSGSVMSLHNLYFFLLASMSTYMLCI